MQADIPAEEYVRLHRLDFYLEDALQSLDYHASLEKDYSAAKESAKEAASNNPISLKDSINSLKDALNIGRSSREVQSSGYGQQSQSTANAAATAAEKGHGGLTPNLPEPGTLHGHYDVLSNYFFGVLSGDHIKNGQYEYVKKTRWNRRAFVSRIRDSVFRKFPGEKHLTLSDFYSFVQTECIDFPEEEIPSALPLEPITTNLAEIGAEEFHTEIAEASLPSKGAALEAWKQCAPTGSNREDEKKVARYTLESLESYWAFGFVWPDYVEDLRCLFENEGMTANTVSESSVTKVEKDGAYAKVLGERTILQHAYSSLEWQELASYVEHLFREVEKISASEKASSREETESEETAEECDRPSKSVSSSDKKATKSYGSSGTEGLSSDTDTLKDTLSGTQLSTACSRPTADRVKQRYYTLSAVLRMFVKSGRFVGHCCGINPTQKPQVEHYIDVRNVLGILASVEDEEARQRKLKAARDHHKKRRGRR